MTSTRIRGRYGLRQVVRMEWIKLRSLRSTWWTLAITVAAAVGIGIAVGVNTKDASGDLTNNALAGIAVGLLLTGVLGVLVMTGEYGSGLIRTSLAAVPDRRRLLAAKAAVFGTLAMAAGQAAAFIAFLAGRAALPHRIPGPGLGDPHVLRAVILAGTGYCFIGLIGLGLGAVIRHTPAAIAILVGGVYIVTQLAGALAMDTVGRYAPVAIVANSLSVVQPVPGMLTPWTGLGVLCLYAAVALAAGGWALTRRDA